MMGTKLCNRRCRRSAGPILAASLALLLCSFGAVRKSHAQAGGFSIGGITQTAGIVGMGILMSVPVLMIDIGILIQLGEGKPVRLALSVNDLIGSSLLMAPSIAFIADRRLAPEMTTIGVPFLTFGTASFVLSSVGLAKRPRAARAPVPLPIPNVASPLPPSPPVPEIPAE